MALPAILVPYPARRRRPPERRTRAGWPQAGAAVVIADGELTAARLARRSLALLADRSRLAAMARGLARAGAPATRPRRSPASCSRRPHERAPGRRGSAVGGAAAALRRRRRGGDERLRARGARARAPRSAARTPRSTPYLERLAADGVLDAQHRPRAPRTCPRRRGRRARLLLGGRRRTTPSASPRASAGCAERPRAELLAELTALRRTIAVAGTHGKTTTASMIVHALRAAGSSRAGWSAARSAAAWRTPSGRTGEWLVVEADESDRSMLSLDVEIAVLTNVELDHHATFGSLAELREAFREFLARARAAVGLWDRPELLALARPRTRRSPLRRRAAAHADRRGLALPLARAEV